VNHGVLASLNPEQVEVEIWRADELEVLRGLSSELDEMWSYVCKKATLLLDSGVLGSRVVREAQLMFKAIDK
jgi:hypothetical protein